MLAIVWYPTGFAAVTALESGCKFDTGYYLSELLTPLSEWSREGGGGNFRNLIVHADEPPAAKPPCCGSLWPGTR
jgi:hypothetical protein